MPRNRAAVRALSRRNVALQKAAVLIASHNRRERTLASLDTLFRQHSVADLAVDVFLVDDGCTDGTGEAIRSRFPSVHVLRGNGSLYWNGAMRLAFAVAMHMRFDAYILLNDDMILYKDALERLVSLARLRLEAGSPALVVGSARSPRTGQQSYGGLIRRARGMKVQLQMLATHPSQALGCETMHGNFVLIPAEIAAVLGNLDEHFQHQFADLDYGLRASQSGFEVVVIPGYAGDCSDNSEEGTWRDTNLGLAGRLRHLVSPKGVPIKEWALFTRRHFGWRWLASTPSPYVKTLLSSALSARPARRPGAARPPGQGSYDA
jgi:GT2 family glycosyltransferase